MVFRSFPAANVNGKFVTRCAIAGHRRCEDFDLPVENVIKIGGEIFFGLQIKPFEEINKCCC
jgi:hypothetical protein